MQFIDTAGAGYEEQPEPDGESRLNPQEAAWCAARSRACWRPACRPRTWR